MTRYDLSTIGEGQIRLTCFKGERLSNANKLRMTAACSEANVSGVLAQLGRETLWTSVLPEGDLGNRVVNEFRSAGVDISNVRRTSSGRLALYFMEPGESPMPARVIYDREHSPFRSIDKDSLDWEKMLDTRLVFVTGITAALTDQTADVLSTFVQEARKRGIPIILDVNYRSLLWSPERARAVLEPIARVSSVVFCSRRDAETVFGIEGTPVEVNRRLREWLDVPAVVSTDQTDGVYVSSVEHGDHLYPVVRVPVVDRPGAGDSFVAGTIHGYLNGDLLAGVEYGQRIASFALTHIGDLTRISPAELEASANTDILR